ncbi:MAG: ribokinase [Pantoea agglomerans]|nr:ribokinase [Pantoea agglomerans]
MSKNAKLAVLGSINADHILNLAHFPRPGETVIGQNYQIAFGGKCWCRYRIYRLCGR